MVLCSEEVGVGASRIGLSAEPEERAGGGEAGAQGVAGGEGDGASGDAEPERGQRAPPGRAGQATELVGGVGKGLSAVEESSVLGVRVEAGEVANEVAEVAGVGAVLGAVLAAKVEDLVERHGGEVERDLLEVDRDDVTGGG